MTLKSNAATRSFWKRVGTFSQLDSNSPEFLRPIANPLAWAVSASHLEGRKLETEIASFDDPKEVESLLEVINLVLVASTIGNLVGIRVDIVRVKSVTSLLLGGLDPFSHNRLDAGDT